MGEIPPVSPITPGGVVLKRPPILTSCLFTGGLRRFSEPPLCLAFAIPAIQAGCCGGGGATLGFGESGLFRALSSQLAFVGLHRRLSINFEGLLGGVVSFLLFLRVSVSLSFAPN